MCSFNAHLANTYGKNSGAILLPVSSPDGNPALTGGADRARRGLSVNIQAICFHILKCRIYAVIVKEGGGSHGKGSVCCPQRSCSTVKTDGAVAMGRTSGCGRFADRPQCNLDCLLFRLTCSGMPGGSPPGLFFVCLGSLDPDTLKPERAVSYCY